MKLNLVMIVKNEERCLERCLRQAAPLADRMIVVDTGSADRTKEIAEEMGAEVLDYQWTNDFSAARNFALEHSDADWNLVLDADEYLRPCDRKKLEEMLEKRSKSLGSGWMGAITCYNTFPDGDEISVSATSIPRLLPAGVRYSGMIHEQPGAEDMPCYRVPLEADHDGYMKENKGERNLRYLEQAAAAHPEDPYYVFQVAATLRNLKRLPESLLWFRRFYQNEPGEGEYRVSGVLLYLYTLLDLADTGDTSCLQEAWNIIEKEKGRLGDRADFWFVCGLFYMKLVLSDVQTYIQYLPEIEASYLRCLSIGEHPEKGGVLGTGSFKAAYNLGAWYEVSGQMEKAGYYYRQAASEGYEPARKRLSFQKS